MIPEDEPMIMLSMLVRMRIRMLNHKIWIHTISPKIY